MNMPSYDNAGGTGDRTATITVSATLLFYGNQVLLHHWVNGVKTSADDLYFNPGDGTPSGKYLRFDFGVGASKLITEAKLYQELTTSHCNVKWQGSNNGTDWTDIGSAFRLGGATTQTQTELSGNALGYRYYQLIGADDTYGTSAAPYLYEYEFKIDDYSAAGGAPGAVRRRRLLMGVPNA